MPMTGIATLAATSETCASAIGRIAGPDRPPFPPPSHGSRASRRERPRSQRVDQRHRVRPTRLRAGGARRDVGGVGRELDDQRLGGTRAQHRQQGLELARIGPDVQAGRDVGAGHIELDRRHGILRPDRLDKLANSSSVEPITFVISGTPSCASAGRSCSR